MSKRTTCAKWSDKRKHWYIRVQKDNQKKDFYSAKKGKKGQIEVHKKADEWLDGNIVSSSIYVTDVCSQWLDEVKIMTGTHNYVQYESISRLYIVPKLGHLKFDKIDEDKLQNIITSAYQEKELSKKYLSNIRGTIVALIKYARRKKYTALDSVCLKIPTLAKKSVKKVLDPLDVKKLFQSNKTVWRENECNDWNIHTYRFTVITGMRPSEIFGLKESDIDGNTVVINRGVNKFNEITECKNENAKRTFNLSPLAIRILNEQRAQISSNNIKTEYIFAREDGSTNNVVSLLKRWKVYQDYNEMSGITLYELRHTFISICKGRINKDALKTMVGHSASMDTFGVYGHYFDDGRYNEDALQVESLFLNLMNK